MTKNCQTDREAEGREARRGTGGPAGGRADGRTGGRADGRVGRWRVCREEAGMHLQMFRFLTKHASNIIFL